MVAFGVFGASSFRSARTDACTFAFSLSATLLDLDLVSDALDVFSVEFRLTAFFVAVFFASPLVSFVFDPCESLAWAFSFSFAAVNDRVLLDVER